MDRQTFKSYKRNLYRLFSTRKERDQNAKNNVSSCFESDLVNVIKQVKNISIIHDPIVEEIPKDHIPRENIFLVNYLTENLVGKVNSLKQVDKSVQNNLFASFSNELDRDTLWHYRLGHTALSTLSKMVEEGHWS